VTADSTAGSAGTATITAYAGDPNNPLTKSGSTTCNVLAAADVHRGIRAFSISSQVSGGNLSVSTTVLNDGNVKVDTFRVGIYLSADNVITPGGDILIGSRTVSELQKGATSSTTQSIPLAGVSTGTYYVGMYADDLAQINEDNENNNAKSSTSTYPIGPNLKVYSLIGTLSGGNISVSSTVQNAGNVTAPAPFDVEFYFSSDSTLDGGDTLIGSRTVTGDLGVNQTDSASSLIPIPPTLSTGTYRVLAFVDSGNAVTEINEGDNVKATGGTYLIGPDLRVYSLIASLSGSNVIASDTEIDQGNQPTGPFDVSFYLSSDTTLDGGDLLIGSRSVGALGVNQTDSTSTTLSLDSVPVGDYYLCALSDSGNAVIETNEGNNSRCATTLLRIGPDLKVFNLSVVLSAGNLSVSDTEINSGNQVAGAATVTFYLSSNTTLDGGDAVLGSRNFPSLGINSTSSDTNLFSPGGAHGIYYVIAVTDSANAVAENNNTGSGETNNTKVSGGVNIP
jgi:hypothetical protein